MAYLKQDQLPTASTAKIGFGYSAIAVSDGGCTIAAYRDRHVYLFPTISPKVASFIVELPEKHHKLDKNNQISICSRSGKCYHLNEVELVKSYNDKGETHSKNPIYGGILVNHIKFILSGQLLFVAGPKILCIINFEQLDDPCILNVNLFQIYNKVYKCIYQDLIETSSEILSSIDIICYRKNVKYNNETFQLIDIIASYKPQRPLLIRFYFNRKNYIIDCKMSYKFNQYLLGLNKEIQIKMDLKQGDSEEKELLYDIFAPREDQKIIHQNHNFPACVILTHKSKNARLLHQAMSLNSINSKEFEKINNFENYLSNFNHEYGGELVLAVGPKHLCIVSLIYNCQGLFQRDDENYCYYCIDPPDCRCFNAEFVQMPWRNHLPKAIYSHPKIEMFAILFSDRFFILTNQHYATTFDFINSQDLSDEIPLSGRQWFIKYNFIEPIVKQNCFYGAFSGEPITNYFICTWKTTFSYEIALYDNRANTGIGAKRLILNTSKYRGLSQFVWVPNYRIIIGIGGYSGELIYITPNTPTNWIHMIPDFIHITQNVEYIEQEDDFDQYQQDNPSEYLYKNSELWNSPWELISHKLGINKFKFYDLQHILSSKSIDDNDDPLIDLTQIPAEYFN